MRLKEYKGFSLVVTAIVVFVMWQLMGGLIDKAILPTPIEIAANIVHAFKREIGIHVLYSLMRIGSGILCTLVIGIPLGILMGYVEKVDRVCSPLLYFSYPVPKIALLPIVMLLFGLGEWTKISMIFMIVFFPIVINIRDEVKNIPEEVLYPMYSIGATRLEILREIILPATVPVILTSLRIGIGTAISVLFFTENFGTQYGMGFYIMDSWMRINYIDMYSGIMILSLIGLGFFMVIDWLESHLCPWNK